jgi:ribosomal protein S18 acetylase RimI-like enzyme
VTQAVRIADVEGAASLAIARDLIHEYATWLAIDLEYQNFEHELATFPGDYTAPHGALLLAHTEEGAVGCVALRRLEPGICEMKRLWVRQGFQGRGLGKALAVAALDRARRLGYRRMRLDTLPQMVSALALYRDLGFRDIPPYYASPIPGTLYLEIELGRAAG